MSAWMPILAGAALGFVKGWASGEPSDGFQADRDLLGPVKEELVYRGPLWLFPNLPVGTTAVVFAGDHMISDAKSSPEMTPMEFVARLGDVFLGGVIYEQSFRESGILGAIASHTAHNNFVRLGQYLRLDQTSARGT